MPVKVATVYAHKQTDGMGFEVDYDISMAAQPEDTPV